MSLAHSMATALIVLLPVTGHVHAQRIDVTKVGFRSSIVGSRSVVPDITPDVLEGTYWKEVGIVTAIVGVVALNAWAPRKPSLPVRIVASIPAAAFFFLPGAFIGSLFAKGPPGAGSGEN